MTGSKQEIRAIMRERRRALSPGQQQRHALQLALYVACRQWFRRAGHIALYRAMDGEIDLTPLMGLCWRHRKLVYLPRIDSDREMRFACFEKGDRLVRNQYGIQQPPLTARAADPDHLDIIFAPLVAFSAEGLRLGMGGGFYDRALAGRRSDHLVGVAHSCQRAECLPQDPWDVPLARVLTEKGALRPPR